MSSIELIVVMLIAIGSAIAAVLTTVAVSSVVEASRLRRGPLLADARQTIVTALSGEESKLQEAFASLGRLSDRHVVALMLDLVPSVSGTSRDVLISLGNMIGILPRARKGVTSRRWATRLYSTRILTAFGVATNDMPALLADRFPDVRAQAAAWAVVAPSPEAIQGLIGLLSDDDGLCRFAAQDALIRIGLPGSDALMRALNQANENEELTDRILKVVAAMGDERFFSTATWLTTDPAPSTRAWACAVLARTGNASAGGSLVRLLSDPSANVVVAAAAGIAKLDYWPGAVHVEPLLDHSAWEVRKQAVETLLAVGAPGTIMLRAAVRDAGPASDMAAQALELDYLTNRVAIA